MSIHCCFLDDDCRNVITGKRCWRIEIHTPWRHLGIALTKDSMYQAQPYNLDRWTHFSWEKVVREAL